MSFQRCSGVAPFWRQRDRASCLSMRTSRRLRRFAVHRQPPTQGTAFRPQGPAVLDRNAAAKSAGNSLWQREHAVRRRAIEHARSVTGYFGSVPQVFGSSGQCSLVGSCPRPDRRHARPVRSGRHGSPERRGRSTLRRRLRGARCSKDLLHCSTLG